MSAADTIFALATPPGKSGVAIIRLSGPSALPALQQLSGLKDITPRTAHYVILRSPQEKIDNGVALYFKAPHSFTGEDVVELQIHGSLAVIRQLLDILSRMNGLRLAEPGEFTRRAFVNGKMDLIEAEGLADLIEAETTQQKSQALRQMSGSLSQYYEKLRTDIIRVLAHLEAYIDFPDEDIPQDVLHGLDGQINAITHDIKTVLGDEHRGERVRDGVHVVILGAPNVGKSSLLNALAKRDAAIVSTRAGTTRDVIEVHMDIAGYPVILVDTAGIRESTDEIEAEGIRRALQRADHADIKLVLFDGAAWPKRDESSAALIDEGAIAIVSKCDLAKQASSLEMKDVVFVSTRSGQGIESLLKKIEQNIISHFSGANAPFITRNRHRMCLEEGLFYLENAQKNAILELKCEELRLAAQAVGKITGKIQVDDVLDVVFSQFCIGK